MTAPTLPKPSSAFDTLARRLAVTGPAIDAARARTAEQRARLAEAVAELTPPDTSLVVVGSLARGEVTAGSDIDWTLLVDGQADARHQDAVVDIRQAMLDLGLKDPGPEGTFGGLAFSHELLHYIGGGDDTNRNTTQRMLLLLESTAIGSPDAYDRVRRQLLRRYVEEDLGWQLGQTAADVPRFLQNDVARYWRTVAVDFAYKRRERQAKGWALRTIKLRLSRKLTYVAGLLACYSCAEVDLPPGDGGRQSMRTLALVDHLHTYLRQPPLDILAAALLAGAASDRLMKAARELFTAYDAFLALLDTAALRDLLDKLPPGEAATSPEYQYGRKLGHAFADALDAIFLERDDDNALYRLTRAYGVF